MKSIKKYLATIAMVSALGASGAANAALTNWYIDADGAGSNDAVQVTSYLDLIGRAYVHNEFTTLSTFNFNEAGTFTSTSADGKPSTKSLSPNLISEFTATGSGTVGGALSFLTGSLTVRSGATTIGIFELLTGSANLVTNSTLPNGTVSLIFKATSLATGYFFDSAHNDLSDVVTPVDLNRLLFGFATTNVISLDPELVDDELVNQYNASFSPDQTGPITSNLTTDLLLSNNGQFKLEVPEPGSLALLGLSLFGLGAIRRRKQ